MSVHRNSSKQFVDDRHPTSRIDPGKLVYYERAGVDPESVVPEGFCQRYGTTSIRRALRRAERDARDGDDRQLPRCGACGSTKLISKPGSREIPNKRDDKPYKCGECGEHLSSRGESLEESMPGEQSTLRELPRE